MTASAVQQLIIDAGVPVSPWRSSGGNLAACRARQDRAFAANPAGLQLLIAYRQFLDELDHVGDLRKPDKPLRVTPPLAAPNSILPQPDRERLGKPLSYGAPRSHRRF